MDVIELAGVSVLLREIAKYVAFLLSSSSSDCALLYSEGRRVLSLIEAVLVVVLVVSFVRVVEEAKTIEAEWTAM